MSATLPPFTEQYRTRDAERATWGPGPWDDEPDKVVWTDETTGFAAMVVRGPSGALCGYVGLPSSHPFHGRGYDECTGGCEETYCEHSVEVMMTVHGGITFADSCDDRAEDHRTAICHLDEDGGPVWWFGFDTAHCGDLLPYHSMRRARSGDVYRDLPYVVNEVTSLAAQLSERAS